MSKYVTKQIPVCPHVKMFLQYYFGNRYTFSQNDFFGKLIVCVFKKGYRKEPIIKGDDTYPARFLPGHIKLLGDHIEWSDVIYLNKGIDDIFRKLLFFHMDMMRKVNDDNIYEKMQESLYEFSITEDHINIDSLYRDYRRNRKYDKTIKRKIDLDTDLDYIKAS